MIVRLNEAQGDDIAAIAAEAGACAGDGAGAVEFLVPLSAVEDGDVGLVGDLIEACRTTAGPGVALRILTPGGSVDPSMATAIARTAIMAGVDFLGVTMPSASGPLDLDLCAVLLSVAMEAEGKVGFKLSQGKSALAPLASLAQAILGPEWLRPANIRVEERHFVTRFQQ
ncbi:beta/alpha barrel domain-containing protein [Arboricoccus pini]|nr:hypothetical protein [Arboricoccus pini]